jgi:Ion channel
VGVAEAMKAGVTPAVVWRRRPVPSRNLGNGMDSRSLRRNFVAGLIAGLRVVWPILSGLLGLIIALGLVVGLIEGWSVHESIYFAFVSGLTIGYGDLAPKSFLTRVLAILIGVCGVLLTALVAAIAVKALTAASGDGKG